MLPIISYYHKIKILNVIDNKLLSITLLINHSKLVLLVFYHMFFFIRFNYNYYAFHIKLNTQTIIFRLPLNSQFVQYVEK